MCPSHGRAAWTVAALVLSAVEHAGAQRTALPALGPVPTLDVAACSGATASRDPVLDLAFAARELPPAEARSALIALEDSLAALLPEHPDDVAPLFRVALVLGVRTEVEDGRDKLKVVQQLLPILRRVLELDPSHPGAQYLLGRLNAAVMRMSRVSRFLAINVLGGSELSSASWDEAQRLLESAAEGDPCAADPVYELARLHQDRGEPALAAAQLKRLFRRGARDAHGRVVLERGRDLLASLGGGRPDGEQ